MHIYYMNGDGCHRTRPAVYQLTTAAPWTAHPVVAYHEPNSTGVHP